MTTPSSPVATPAATADATAETTGALVRRSAWKDWLELTKPEITLLVALSSAAGFMLGSPGPLAWTTLGWTVIGVVLASAGGSVLNHVLEHDLDGLMRRTVDRPIPAGRITVKSATVFGVLLVAAGVGLLCPLTNPLTGTLAAGTVALYLFVYTPLKQRSSINTLVGTIPGALPALGGWTAATGSVGAGGLALFAVLVCWQMPHFYSLAWMYRADYARAKYLMLPVVAPDGHSTARQTVIFSVLLLIVSLIPAALGVAGTTYAVGAAILGIWMLIPVFRFARTRTNPDARRLLKATVYYIPLLVLLIVIDRLVRS